MTDSNFTKTLTTDNFTQFINNTNTIGKEVGGLARLTTTVDSDLVGAINELDSDIGARPHTTLTTNTKTLTAAINELHTSGGASLTNLVADSAGKLGGFNDSAERNTTGNALNSLSADVRTLDSDVGSVRAKTTLTTTSKTIIGSINELDAEIGDSALDSGFTGMTIRRAINALDSNHDSAVTQLKTDIGNVFRYQTISGDTGSDTVDSANGSIAIVGDGIIQTTMSGNRLLVDHTVVGATDVNNSGNTFVQDVTMDSAGHVTAISSGAVAITNTDVSAGAAINAEKIHDGTVSNTEFGHLNGVTSAIQTQFNAISFDSAGLQTQLNALDTAKTTLTAVFSMIYPVGSIYINAGVSTSPATLMGFGTWSRYGEGKVLVSQSSSDTEFDTLGETGGAKTHTLTEAQLPAHRHFLFRNVSVPNIGDTTSSLSAAHHYDNGSESYRIRKSSSTNAFLEPDITLSGQTGSGSAHNNLQPYIVVYMWRRTA
tara:strand:+ start:60 stop:1517 length:1458 start_codon:yes stop_codon:yes gene_type:complete